MLHLLHWEILRCNLLWFEESLLIFIFIFFHSVLKIISHQSSVAHIFISVMHHNLVISSFSVITGGLYSLAKRIDSS